MKSLVHSQVTVEGEVRSGVQSRKDGKMVKRYQRQRETASKHSKMANMDTARVNQICTKHQMKDTVLNLEDCD